MWRVVFACHLLQDRYYTPTFSCGCSCAMKKFFTSVAVLVLAVALDQLSKWYAAVLCATAGGGVSLFKFCNIVQVWNPGISFGMFSTIKNGNIAFMGVSVIITCVLAFMLMRERTISRVICLGLIIGGALGNFIDRVRVGAVYDFIDLHVAGWHWPAFNIADACILCGVITFLFLELRSKKDHEAGSDT